ncbi:bacterial Ig-like domain-containing protein, partial [Enterococcus faecalis]
MINHNKFLQIFTTSLLVGSTLLTSIPVNAEVAEEVPTSSAKETTTNKSSTDDFAESTSTQQSTDIPTYDSSNNEAESVVADRIDTSSSDQITLKNSDDTPASSDSNKEQKATMRRAAAEDESISSWMPDSALQQAVSKKLNIPIEQLTKEDLVGLHSLTVSGVTSLKGLEYASEIIQLSAINGSITDLSPLSGLLNLEVLSLNANNINDLSIISTLSGLETLSFSNNPISKLPDFSQNSNLTGITGSNCFITDLTPLGTLPKHAVVTFQNQHIDPINLMIDKGSSEVKTSGVIKKIDGSWANPASLAPATTSKWDGTNFIFSGPGDYSASYRVPGNSMISLDYNSSIQFHVDQLLENIKVEYLNEEDNLPIHDPVMISGLFGESYDATTSQYKLEINGFTLDEAKLPSNATGTITKMDKIVKYYYKKDLTSVSVHDSTIYVGDEWKAEDNFDSALNKDGEAVEFKDITVDDSQKDTSKAGTFDVTYTYDGVTSTATITVK